MIIIFVLDENGNQIIQTLYAKNRARLLYVAKSYLGNRAEDAVHDAFLKIIEKFDGKFEELCDKDAYYFVTIVKNHSIDILRKEKQAELFDIEDEAAAIFVEEQNPQRIVESKDELNALVELLDRLKPAYRQVLEYKYILGFDNKEIAEKLSTSPSVVSTRVNRARNELKMLMERGANP